MKITNPCATINYFLTAVPTKNEIDSINHIITRYDSLGFAGDLTVEKKKRVFVWFDRDFFNVELT